MDDGSRVGRADSAGAGDPASALMSSDWPRLTDPGGAEIAPSYNFSTGRIVGSGLTLGACSGCLATDSSSMFIISSLELVFEFIAGALELGKGLSQLASQLGQLARADDDQGQQKDEDHLRHAEIHGFIIMPATRSSNRTRKADAEGQGRGQRDTQSSSPVTKVGAGAEECEGSHAGGRKPRLAPPARYRC